MWALGIIMHQLVTGKLLFKNDELTKERIMNDNVDLVDDEWDEMSYEARDLCESLLKKIDVLRPSA